MRKPVSLFLFAVALAMPAFGVAAERITREVKIAFGYVTNPDGTKRSVKGLTIPLTLERIKAEPTSTAKLSQNQYERNILRRTAFGRFFDSINRGPLPGLNGERHGVMSSDIYLSDGGVGNYKYLDPVEFADPSSLDGMLTSGGAGRPWEQITWGVHVENGSDAIVRFRCYSTYNPNAAPGDPAFTNVFADFGFSLVGVFTPGDWMVPNIPVANVGIVSPSNQVYVATQYRALSPDGQGGDTGEGAFNPDYYVIYSIVSPSIGSSEDNWWYDWDPQNGIYTNEELEVLGDGVGTTYPSNFLFKIGAGTGTQDTITPDRLTFLAGSSRVGTVASVRFSDDNYATLKRGIILNPNDDPMQVEVEGFASTRFPISLKFQYEVATTTAGAPVKAYLYNFNTGLYDLVATHTSSAADTVYEHIVQSVPSRYISAADNSMKAKITFRSIPTLAFDWKARIDRTVWFITR